MDRELLSSGEMSPTIKTTDLVSGPQRQAKSGPSETHDLKRYLHDRGDEYSTRGNSKLGKVYLEIANISQVILPHTSVNLEWAPMMH